MAQAKTEIAIAFDSFGAAYGQYGPRPHDSRRSRYALFMADIRINRKLAAILAADVVGYSRLMEADEAGTLGALKRHRETIFDPAVVVHNGRIVKLIGDGTIVEFGSVVDAVNCALALQRSGTSLPVSSAREPTIVLRIGINLGDVIIENDDIYGDGVNIAARLEPLAEPGGVCVSSIVHESVGNRIDVHFQDGGDVSVKNIDRPIRVWKWHPGKRMSPLSNPMPPIRRPKSRRRRSPFCRSRTCRATPNRNTSPTASAKTLLPICRRSPV
ncbi:MAG: adenylate/guanylate cyclase domain-containing protein [Xanthobacteraceae bacterium]